MLPLLQFIAQVGVIPGSIMAEIITLPCKTLAPTYCKPVSVSLQVIQQLGFGLGSKILLDDGTNKMTSDFIFSSSFIATQWMYTALVVDNLIQSSDARTRNLYRTFYAAFKFIPTKEVEFYLDPLYSPDYAAGTKAGFSLGVELGLLADFYLRAGRFVDAEIEYLNTRGAGYGVGLGWIGPRINFDYALSRVLSSHINVGNMTAHALTTTIFF